MSDDTAPLPAGRGESEDPRNLRLANELAEYVERMRRGEKPGQSEGAEPLPAPSPELREAIEALQIIEQGIGDWDERVPSVLGDFQKLRELGRGAMGTVYEALQLSLGRRVALKLLTLDSRSDATRARARFQREGRALASLKHPRIVPIYAAGVEEETPYIAMELVRGETLQSFLSRIRSNEDSPQTPKERGKRRSTDLNKLFARSSAVAAVKPQGPCTPPAPPGPDVGAVSAEAFPEPSSQPQDTANFGEPALERETEKSCYSQIALEFAEVADALHHVHERKIVHRDLKPSNLMLDEGRRLHVVDFGLALMEEEQVLTRSGEGPGTPQYMSPEQFVRGASRATARSDIYSLGVTLYEVLSGELPIRAGSVPELCQRITLTDPMPLRRWNPEVPRDLETIVHQCLHKNPADRYQTAEALAQDLRRFVRDDPVEARRMSYAARMVRRIWRTRRRFSEVAALIILLLGGVGWGWREWVDAQHRDRLANFAAVEEAELKLLRRPLLSAAVRAGTESGDGSPFSVLEDEPLEISRRMAGEGGHYRILESGYDAVEVGPILADTGGDSLKEGIADLERCLDRWPHEPAAYYHLARGWVARGDRPAALAAIEKLLQLDPAFEPALGLRSALLDSQAAAGRADASGLASAGEPRSWVEVWSLAHTAVLRRNWAAAAEAYGTIFRGYLEGRDRYAGALVEVRLEKGLASLLSGDLLGALDDFAAAGEAFPEAMEPRLLKGKILWLQGDRVRAERVFDGMHDAADPVQGPDVALVIAQALQELGDLVASRRWLEKVGETPVRWCAESEIARRLGDAGRAVESAQRAMALDPRDPRTLLALGNANLLRRAVVEARGAFERAARENGSPADCQIALSLCLEAEGRLEEAAASLREVAQRETTSVVAHYNLGRVLARTGNRPAAREAYSRATEIDPVHAPSLNNLGLLQYLDGRLDDALEHFSRAVAAAPRLRIAHYNLAWGLHRQRRFLEAADSYQRAITLGLHTPEVRNNLAACLAHMRRLEEAEELYRRVLLDTPDDPRSLHGLAVVLEYRGANEEALDIFRRCRDVVPDWSDVHNNYGNLLRHFRRNAESERELRRAIELDGRHVWPYVNLAELLLTWERELPPRSLLIEDLNRFEAARRYPGATAAMGTLVTLLRKQIGAYPATLAAVDDLVTGPVSLLADQAAAGGRGWRSLRVDSRASAPAGWKDLDFDASAWSQVLEGGPSVSGATVAGEPPTRERHVILLRAELSVERVDQLRALRLEAHLSDGFLVYVNGRNAGGLRAGEASDEALDPERRPWIAQTIEVDPALLRDGRNVVGIVVLGAPFPAVHALPDLVGEYSSARPEAIQRGLEACAAAPAGAGDPAVVRYLEGRLRQAEGRYPEAISLYERVVGQPARLEPVLRIAECLQASGAAEESEIRLREALKQGAAASDALWDAWFQLVVNHMGRSPAQALTGLQDPGLEAPSRKIHPAADYRWLLTKLAAGRPLRLDCGGPGHRAKDGTIWGRDRFYRGGTDRYQTAVAESLRREGIDPKRCNVRAFEDDWYWNPGRKTIPAYRVPLPRGRYRATFHFVVGGSSKERAKFDLIVEGVRIATVDLTRGSISDLLTESAEFDLQDGAMDVAFAIGKGTPAICGLEIETLSPSR